MSQPHLTPRSRPAEATPRCPCQYERRAIERIDRARGRAIVGAGALLVRATGRRSAVVPHDGCDDADGAVGPDRRGDHRTGRPGHRRVPGRGHRVDGRGRGRRRRGARPAAGDTRHDRARTRTPPEAGGARAGPARPLGGARRRRPSSRCPVVDADTHGLRQHRARRRDQPEIAADVDPDVAAAQQAVLDAQQDGGRRARPGRSRPRLGDRRLRMPSPPSMTRPRRSPRARRRWPPSSMRSARSCRRAGCGHRSGRCPRRPARRVGRRARVVDGRTDRDRDTDRDRAAERRTDGR